MTFAVVWNVAAVRQLSLLVAAAAVTDPIHEAARWIDYTLRRIPFDVGESRGTNHRLWYSDLLGNYFKVDDDALRVTVLAVGPARRRR